MYIQPTETQILGKSQADHVEAHINTHLDEDAKLFQYSVSKFKYNFTRGSKSSIEFLKAYADEEDELVLRSKLRHIVDKKFKESIPFLVTIALIFTSFLLLYFYQILTDDHSWYITIPLIVFNTFFFMLECRQLFTDGLEYFTDFWNYVDISVFGINYFLFFYDGDHNGTV